MDMVEEEKFSPLMEGISNSNRLSSTSKRNIIKGNNVRVAEPVKIKIEPADTSDEVVESITPLIENGTVVGVIHACTCGKTTEIRFEFE